MSYIFNSLNFIMDYYLKCYDFLLVSFYGEHPVFHFFFNQKRTLFGNICRFVFVYYFYVTLPEKFHLDYKLVKLYTSPNQKRLYKKVADSYECLGILIYV